VGAEAGGIEHADEQGQAFAPAAGLVGDWEAAYRENLGWVYRLIYGRVGNRPDAEDLTAEVFLRALPRLRLSGAPEALRAYLSATCRAVVADYWRRHYDADVGHALPDELASAAESANATAVEDNTRRANRLLALLPDHYRRVLELRFLSGCSVRETAKTLQISVNHAKVLQHRALRRAAELGARELS
jgi:RNA polymerase sigma-70 factor (ECF subfamily)